MDGYAQLAWRMSVHGDLAVVRRFAALNIQNILYLQAELVHLEERLREKERANSSSENETLRWYARDWQTLSRGQSHEGEDESQWRLLSASQGAAEGIQYSHSASFLRT
jgi:hypothetical protein